MKIKLTKDIPVEDWHNLVAGRVLDARLNPRRSRGAVKWFVTGGDDAQVGIFADEAEEVVGLEDSAAVAA